MLVKEETMEIEGLPFQVHVDDAKDKVFVAILRSLVILKNTPSSPKKLAATIIEHRLAKLGGQTPFATVSSRISQHFKRSTSHELSRKPLLIKHMDEQHARKSRYSIDDCLLQSPIQAKHEISLRTSNSPALEANEQDIAAAITITKMSQQPHYKEPRPQQAETVDVIEKNTEETPKVKTRQETIQGHTFTLTKRWLGYLELHELDSPSDIPNTKVSRFSSTDPKLSYSYVNATQLRKAAIPVLGEGVFDIERERREGGGIAVVISSGPLESNDVWIPLERARELMEEFEIESSPGLTRLLSDELLSECFSDENHLKNNIPETKQHNTLVESSKRHVRIAPTPQKPSEETIVPQLNMNTLQQLMMALPQFLQSPAQSALFSKVLTTYLQYLATFNSAQPTIASSEINKHSVHPHMMLTNSSSQNDINMMSNDTLSNRKEVDEIPSGVPDIPTPPMTEMNSPFTIKTIEPTTPYMEITVIDHVAVCIAFLVKDGQEYRIMRRLDTSYINGTQLLIAGGIETESERSMILSFEMSRVRMPNRQSDLFGTWIPYRRAHELAATCSIQHMLHAFFSDHLEQLFPSPLPSFINNNKRRTRTNSIPSTDDAMRNHHLAALTLAALKNPVVMSDSHRSHQQQQEQQQQEQQEHEQKQQEQQQSPSELYPISTIDRQVSLTHPSRTLKTAAEYTLKAPHLGHFEDAQNDIQKHVVIIDKPTSQNLAVVSFGKESPFIGRHESDIDVEALDYAEDMSEDTDTDHDIEEVRKDMRKLRDAAIAAMELDDLLGSTQLPLYSEKNRRRSDGQVRLTERRIMKKQYHSEEEEEEENERKKMDEDDEDIHFSYKVFDFQRKRPAGFVSGGGKWTVSTNAKLFRPTQIKRSATWNGKMTPAAKRQRKSDQHSTSKKECHVQKATAKPIKRKMTTIVTHTVVDENDEGDEVDIGGSDNEDDLR